MSKIPAALDGGWVCDDCRRYSTAGALCACWTKAPESSRATTGSRQLNQAMYDTWVEHMAMPEPGSTDGLVRPYMACVCGWRSDDLLGDDTWVRSDNPGASYADHLANHLHDAAIKALAGRTIALDLPSRLVVCNLSHCGEPDVHAHVVPAATEEAEVLTAVNGIRLHGEPLGEVFARLLPAARARLTVVEAWLREATEHEWAVPCRLDHHGGCQNHGYLDGACPIPAIRTYFEEADRG